MGSKPVFLSDYLNRSVSDPGFFPDRTFFYLSPDPDQPKIRIWNQ